MPSQKDVKAKKVRFTDLTIKHLKPSSKRKIIWCDRNTGFGLRVSQRGSKSWVYMYYFKGKSRMMTLGKYPLMSLRNARLAYANAKYQADCTIDPAKQKVEENIFEREADTVSNLAVKYIEYCIAKGEVAWKEKQRLINKEILPLIGDMKIHNVSFRDIAIIVNTMFVERKKATQAQRLLSHTRCMFKYAKNSLGIIETNPCSDLEAPKRTQKRKRALDTKEIYLFWNNIDYTLMSPVVRSGLRFMLCTLARGVEVRKMKWEDVNFSDRTWLIPSENAKNGRELLLPLNNRAIQILEEIREVTGHSKLVFGHHSTMNYGELKKEYELSVMGGTAFSHAMRDNFDLFNIEERFTPHDLRKTGATCLTSIGYPKGWVSKLLNHTPKGVTSNFYDSFDYFEEKRAGMEAIQYIIDRVLSSKNLDNVPSLRSLRKEFFSGKLIYQFLDEGYYQSQNAVDSQQDSPSTRSNPVTYKLSYDLGTLKGAV